MARLAGCVLGGCATDVGPSAAELRRAGKRRTWCRQLQAGPAGVPAHLSQRSDAYSRCRVSRPVLKRSDPATAMSPACATTSARTRRLCRVERRRRRLHLRQARSLFRRPKECAAFLQGRGLRAVSRTGEAHALVAAVSKRGRATAAGQELGGTVQIKEAESSLGRRGYLTLRFSADVFPRFSTSSN